MSPNVPHFLHVAVNTPKKIEVMTYKTYNNLFAKQFYNHTDLLYDCSYKQKKSVEDVDHFD